MQTNKRVEDKNIIQTLEELKITLSNMDKKINRIASTNDTLTKALISSNEEIAALNLKINMLYDEIHTKDLENVHLKDQLISSEQNLNDKISSLKTMILDLKKNNIAAKEQLLEAYKREEMALKELRKITRMYISLSTSKLGRITRFYWRVKRKLFGGKHN